MEGYRTVYQGATGEYTDRKSRFIAHVKPVSSEEEALRFIEQIRRQYWDAKHNCFAYVIRPDDGSPVMSRASDDGEPAQTAGKPMMDLLQGRQLFNVAAVVTRYFGGILLGTGGLVRAYGGALQEALDRCVIIDKIPAVRMQLQCSYPMYGKVQSRLLEAGGVLINTLYDADVQLWFALPAQEEEPFRKTLLSLSSGTLKPQATGACWLAEVDGSMKIL